MVMGAAAYQTERVLHVIAGDSTVIQGFRVFVAIAVGLAVLAASAQWLRIDEFTENIGLLTRWSRRRRNRAGGSPW
jgi:hypothetical protein